MVSTAKHIYTNKMMEKRAFISPDVSLLLKKEAERGGEGGKGAGGGERI